MHTSTTMHDRRFPPRLNGPYVRDKIIEAFRENNNEFILNFFQDSEINCQYNSAELEFYEVVLQDQPTVACLASYYGNISLLNELQLRGADFNTTDNNNRTCMHFAAAGNHINVLNFLLDHVINPMATDRGGRTFIHYAAEGNHVKILRWARAHDFDLDVTCPTGAPIHYACQFHCLQAVDYLAQQGLDLNRSVSNRTPLILALNAFFFEAIPILQNYGMDINLPGLGGWPVLFYAIRTHNLNLVKNLINLGADVNKQCEMGWTALHVAAQERFYDAVVELVNNGARLLVLTKKRMSPFSFAVGVSNNETDQNTANFLKEKIIELVTMRIERKLIKEAIKHSQTY